MDQIEEFLSLGIMPSADVNAVTSIEESEFFNRFLVGPLRGAVQILEAVCVFAIPDQRKKPISQPCEEHPEYDCPSESNPNLFTNGGTDEPACGVSAPE